MNRRSDANDHASVGILSRLNRLARASFPGRREGFVGAALWGLAMAATAFVGLYMQNRAQTFHLQGILLMYFTGGVIAWPLAVFIGRLLSLGRPRETAFAAFFVSLCFCTMAPTAFIFAMEYRIFFTRWHAPFGTRIWAYQFVFTSASAVYQFIVMGVRLYIPAGIVALTIASMWLARRNCHHRR